MHVRCGHYIGVAPQFAELALDRAISGWKKGDLEDKLVLTALHHGVEVERVRAETGWELEVSADLMITAPPTEAELRRLMLSVDNIIDVISIDIKEDTFSNARELCLARVALACAREKSLDLPGIL